MDAHLFQSLLSDELHAQTRAYISMRQKDLNAIEDGGVLYRALKVPYLKLALPQANWEGMLSEAFALEPAFVPHRSEHSRGWKSLCIHGVSAQQTMAYVDYGYTSEYTTPYQWTEITHRCPLTVSWLQQLLEHGYYDKFFRVRYMWLEPEGYIDFHRDRPEGSCELGPLNVALNMPEGCHWVFKKWGRVPFHAGTAMCVDISNEHAVYNSSRQPRVHMILHGAFGPAYYKAIAEAAKT